MWDKRLSVLVGMLILAVAQTLQADAVYTVDGSKLVGQIRQMYKGKLTIETVVAGTLTIESSQIVAIEANDAMTVEFDSGDRLVGTIAVSSDQSSATMHTALGDLPVESKKMVSVWPEGVESPVLVEVKAEAEKVRLASIPKWTTTIEAGGSRTDGNTDTLQGRGRLDVVRKTSDDMLNFYLVGNYSETNKVRTTNEYYGGIKYENNIDERRLWYTRLELEFDEFEDLDLRTTVAVGGGYYWIKEEPRELKTLYGFGLRHETYNTGVSNGAAVIDFAVNFRQDLGDWAQFTQVTRFSPDIEDTSDYRLDFDTAIVFPLKKDEWKLKLGIRNEYNSRPQPGLERLDNTFYANIVMSLTGGK